MLNAIPTNDDVEEIRRACHKKFSHDKRHARKAVEIRSLAANGLDQCCAHEDGDGEDASSEDLELISSSDLSSNNSNFHPSKSAPIDSESVVSNGSAIDDAIGERAVLISAQGEILRAGKLCLRKKGSSMITMVHQNSKSCIP